jgi:hypothetical protein
MVVLDRFSGFTYLFPVSKTITALDTANKLLKYVFSVNGYPTSIVSDVNPWFTSHFWQQLMKID